MTRRAIFARPYLSAAYLHALERLLLLDDPLHALLKAISVVV
jgi:hypothetical protein